ncbi:MULTISPECIES: THUMP-like domain-containing protein [unclassified Janibacter]|uniref:class I SAM-dependent methyltransferase n=1 Tax=unclassified Janibacter TaxID=2649294 RepID=UPI003CFCAD78
MDIQTVRWLSSPDGQAVLRELPEYRDADVMTTSLALRERGLTPEQAGAALTQKRLRVRARAKFGEFADGMLFTPDGLEQATRLEVAAAHAGRYRAQSLATVHDLGCGIGADAMVLSTLGITVAALDLDPVTAAIADTNLRPWPDSRAHVGDAATFAPPPDAARSRVGVWFDPARRTTGVADITGRTKRVFSLSQISPSWDVVQAMAKEVPATGAKLSPSFPHGAVPADAEAQWTSWSGEVLECAIWWGPLARTHGRTAQVLRAGASPVHVTEADTEPVTWVPGPSALGRWLYEPDKAVLRAGLVGAVTARTSGRELDPGVGYVTSDEALDLPFAKRFAVEEAMAYSVKGLRQWLRDRDVTDVTIKKRGVSIDPDALRAQLRLGRKRSSGRHVTSTQAVQDEAAGSVTLVLTRIASHPVVLVVRPV